MARTAGQPVFKSVYLDEPVGAESIFPFTASRYEPDFDDELIPPAAIDTESYMRNPIMDCDHSLLLGIMNPEMMRGAMESVVAKCVGIDKNRDAMRGLGEWWTGKAYADMVADGYRRGFFNMFSITFLDDAWRKPTSDELADFPGKAISAVLEYAKLISISPVLLGANAGAVYGKSYSDIWGSRNKPELITNLERRIRDLEAQVSGKAVIESPADRLEKITNDLAATDKWLREFATI